MGSLSGQYISQSFVSLIHIGTNNTASATFNVLQDGLGNSLGISVNTLGEISASGNIYGLNITGSAGSINTGSFVTTSSFNSYTASTNTFTASQVSKDLTLATYTASVDTKFTAVGASTSSLNTFSGSQITKNSTLATYTASVDTKFTAVGASTSSLNTATASLFTSASLGLTTASFSGNTLTFTKGNGTTFGIVLPDVSGSTLPAGTVSGSAQITAFGFISSSTAPAGTISGSAQITSLGFVSSSVTASSLVTASVNVNVITFTKGDASTFSLTVAASGSVTPGTVSGSAQIVELGFLQTSSFQTYTGSEDTKNIAIGASTSSLNSFTASAQISINALNTFTASQSTASLVTSITNLNSFTSSQLTINSAIGASTASLNAFTQSQDAKNTTLGNLTGSFATTGSNTFVGNQTITGNITAFSASFTYLQTIFESSSIIYSSGSNQFGDELSDIQTLSGSVKVQGSLTVNGTPVQTSSVDITALNAFTSSQETKNTTLASVTSSLNTATASLFTSSSLALTTASVSLNTITFTKGNGTTFNVTVNTGSAASAFPYTGSAEISGSLKVIGEVQMTGSSASNSTVVSINQAGSGYPIVITGKGNMDYGLFISGSTLSADPAAQIRIIDSSRARIVMANTLTTNDKTHFYIQSNGTSRVGINGYTGVTIGYTDTTATNPNAIYISASKANDTDRNFIGFNANPSSYIGDYNYVFEAANAAQGGARTFIKGHLFVSQSFTASLQDGYAWVGNSTGYNTQVTTSSFATPIPTGTISGSQQITGLGFVSSSVTASSLVTASFSGNTLTFTKGDTTTFGIVLPDVSGSTINTGSFAITGSNVFTGDQTLTDASGNTVTLTDGSGSLILVAKSYTSASAHLSSSANQVNLIFKNSDATADTIISGSGNMFINPASPTAGFKRYVGGSGNIALNGSNIAQISSSMAFSPTMNNNYFGGNSLGLIMRGPVSSSTYTISGNNALGTINIGSSAALHAEKLVSGLTMTGNSVGGTLTIVANQSALTGSTTAFTNNIIAGITQVDMSSSAVSVNNNIINDSGFIFTNQFYSSSVGLGTVAMNRNTIGGQTNSIIISGSLPSGTTTVNSISDNFIFGGSNTIRVDVANARVSGSTAYINVVRTGLMGNQLIVSGSSLLADNSSYGSVFVGRYNANDSIRNKTSDVVFAVGTGNTTTRKTGFLIDSGSNTFVEGTLNVSGATSLNGVVAFTGSAPTILSSSFSGSIITNLTDTYTDVAAVNQIVTLTSASYAALASGSLTNPNTLYVVSGSTAVPDITSLNAFTSSQLTINTGYNTFTASQQLLNTTFATTGSNTFVGNQIITGSVTISGSATTDLTVVGQIFVSSSAAGANTAPKITVSGSTGQTRILGTQVDTRDTTNQGILSTSIVSISNLTNSDEIGLSINPSASLLSPWAQGPGIYVNNDPLDSFNVVFGFQNKANYTDGRVAVLTPLSASAGFTASLQNGYAWVGNSLGQNTQVATSSFATNVSNLATTGSNSFVGNQTITGSLILSSSAAIELQVIGNSTFTGSVAGNVVSASITSNTASIDFSLGNYFEVTSSVTPLRLNITNITSGRTSTLIISASASSSILFSPNVAQPSGSAYSGSLASIDILSLVAFNSSKVNLVATKALV